MDPSATGKLDLHPGQAVTRNPKLPAMQDPKGKMVSQSKVRDRIRGMTPKTRPQNVPSAGDQIGRKISGAVSQALLNEIMGIVEALDNFNVESACGKWYKQATKAIMDAKNGKRGGCKNIHTGIGDNGHFADCMFKINENSASAALKFEQYAKWVQEQCNKGNACSVINGQR